MDTDNRETPSLERAHSTISQCSDGTTSTVTAPLNQRCTCHRELLCPHHDTDPSSDRLQQEDSVASSSFPTTSEPYPCSPTSTDRSSATLGSPTWENSGKYARWKFNGLRDHANDEEDTRQLLKPLPRDETSYQPTLGALKPDQGFQCRSAENVHKGRSHWILIMLLTLSIYTTAFSGLWLTLAIKRQPWGKIIGTRGIITQPNVSFFFPLVAKSIEVSFATVFVAFLGQSLSQKASRRRQSEGISIAEMSMRTWVVQPASLIMGCLSLGHTILSRLSIATLGAALLAMLYTTASDVLVKPQLMFGKRQYSPMSGNVSTSFANVGYIMKHCQTPITPQLDANSSGSTCFEIEHAGQAYHNYMQYLAQWSGSNTSRTFSSNQKERPSPVAMLYDNTTVTGSWIEAKDMKKLSSDYQRLVNNVTMAFPHAGVFTAAHDPTNKIKQPTDLENLGEYHLKGSVPSPSVNVICAGMTELELSPIIYGLWPNADGPAPNITNWPKEFPFPRSLSWMNATAVDDVFGFGAKYTRTPPIFPKLPKPYNTLLNSTARPLDTLYLLANSSESGYTMCSLRASLSPNCSTSYNASAGGGALSSQCEQMSDQLMYGKTHPGAPSGLVDRNWLDVAGHWAEAVALNDGISDFDASNSRLLTQLIPKNDSLNPSLPSIAEALAVLSGCTLLISTLDAPFDHHWNHSVSDLSIPETQQFTAVLQSKQYMSGGLRKWQGIFYIVLGLTFVLNCGCLCYFIKRLFSVDDGGLITDFTEPQNSFALAINSPSSVSLAGACGCGPSKEQFRIRWKIKHDREHDHYYYFSSGEHDALGIDGEKPGFEQLSVEESPAISVSPRL